jgi:signal transduction histidine kinase
VTFQQKLLAGVSLLVLPALIIGLGALRGNAAEQRALETLGERLGRSRTYAELETAMFDQSEVLWRFLTGRDPQARREFGLMGEVIAYRFDRWKAELTPEEASIAEPVAEIQRRFAAVGDSVFKLADAGKQDAAFQYALVEIRNKLHPALTAVNREIYRRTRESSVQGAFQEVQRIVDREQQTLIVVFVASVIAGIAAAFVLARGLARPIQQLREAMAVVGSGDLDHPIEVNTRDEIGELATAFRTMTARLRDSRDELVRLNAELAAKVAQLEATQAQLVQSEKLASIGEMAAAVAHGLRNPLASLRASAQFVAKHPTSAAAAEQLGAIVAEVDRLDRRIAHLLAFSRPAPFHPVPERLAPVVRTILPAFTERLRAQNVALEVALPDTLPAVRIDGPKLEQALTELLANALDAMPDGGRLDLVARPASEAGRPGVLLEVRDTGKGIAPEVLGEVGQPFFTTRPEGTGLGLATARRFVEQLGGRLDLESEWGRGTTVRLWLPADTAADPSPLPVSS